MLLLALAMPGVGPARAADFDYHLEPRQIAPDTWIFLGSTEDFSTANGGNIVNTGFIVTRAGVIVVDTGPSLRYGQQMRQAIARVTSQPVVKAINTHFHPDHFLGNQAYRDVPILALPETAHGEKEDGGAFNDNMYRMNGEWMHDTEPLPATVTDIPTRLELGGHELEFIKLAGHTHSDLAVFDRTTGVLFAGDLVFHDRAPTTPHASIARWLESLAFLEKLPFKILVPGHGAVTSDGVPIVQTRDYLTWLKNDLRQAAADGRDMAELLNQPVPARFQGMALAQKEYRRSITHLFPRFEKAVLEGKEIP